MPRGRPHNPARREALQSGATFYRGKPCRAGHLDGRRYVSTGACVACATGSTDEFEELMNG